MEEREKMYQCQSCGWEGYDSEVTTIDDEGNDLCPACNGKDLKSYP